MKYLLGTTILFLALFAWEYVVARSSKDDFAAAGEMVWKFWFVEHVTFSDFSEGITGIGVAIAAKNWSEKQ